MTSSRPRLIVSAVAALAVFVLMALGIRLQWSWLADFDDAALQFFYRIGTDNSGWVTAWNVFCTVLGPTAFRLVTVVPIVIAFARRNVRIAMFLLISVELSGLLTQGVKFAVDRPRPATALVPALSTSFPSGHALGVMVGTLALLTVVLPLVPPAVRGWLVGLGVVIVVAIGVGRVVLNVHHPSDVLAGWALGYAYFVACRLLVPPLRPITRADEIPEAPGISH